MEWFRRNQRAIQLYDVQHARKAGDVYRNHQMGLTDWRVNMESVAVLQPLADWTQLLQGTTYPTLPLLLPTLYNLIDGMKDGAPLLMAFQDERPYSLPHTEITECVLTARRAMHADMVTRWITTLSPDVKRLMAIASQLHPLFKAYTFAEKILPNEKSWALRELRTEWRTNWKPRPRPAAGNSSTSAELIHEADTVNFDTSSTTAAKSSPVYTKKRKVSLGALLTAVMPSANTEQESSKAPPRNDVDELEDYLQSNEDIVDPEVDILAWWKAKESAWPFLSKMVKQYLAAPASSAGVERVFSAAGRMHGDLSKAVKDCTLQHSLFAAYNTD